MESEQLDAELMKGIESMKSGKPYTTDEMDVELKKVWHMSDVHSVVYVNENFNQA